MRTYAGGTQVQSGYYVDAKSFTFVNVEKDGTTLPGTGDTRFVRVPVMAVMAAAPALGGLFVVALPFIGFGMTAYALVRKLGAGARSGARELAATVATPAAVPGEAHLTGQPPDAGPGDAPVSAVPTDAAGASGDERVAVLEKEIEAQRGTIY